MTPNHLEETTRAMLELYAQAEEKILRAVARRAARGIDTPGWAERKLGEMQELQQQLRKEIEELARQSAELRNSLIEAAYNSGWEDFDREYAYMKGGNIDAIPPARFNATGKLTSELDKSFDALHSAILRTTNDAYRDVIGKAVSMQSTGAITTRQAIKQALNDFADRGITGFTDRAGRHWHMDSYAEMAVRTGMMRASTQGYMDDALAHGENLVIISDHQDTCPLCIDWERTVLALDDAGLNHPDCDGSLAEAEAAGLFHPNCLHSMTVYIPGLSIKASGKSKQGYTREMDMEGYKNRQQQRHMERQVRNWKRRQAVATTPEDERYAKAKVQLWQRRLREHVDNTGLPRVYYREGGRVNLSEAAKKLKPFKVAPNGTIIKPSKSRGISPAKDAFRNSPRHILTPKEIEKLREEIRSIGADESVFRFNQGYATSFHDAVANDANGHIDVCGDVLPNLASKMARARMSSRAVLAHEYYGHYMNRHNPTQYPGKDWRDEMRASYDAALNTPNLTDEERYDLMVDAYDRAREAMQEVPLTDEARRILYGF